MNDAPPLPAERRKRGCWFIGCSILLVVFLVFSAIGAFVIWKSVKAIDPYLATAPLEIQTAIVPDAEFAALQERIADFTRVGPGAPQSLALTAADWNALIARSPEWEAAKGRVQVLIEESEFSVKTSINLDAFPGMSGKFLNGHIFLAPAITDGSLQLPVQRIVVDGQPMTPEAQRGFGEGLRAGFEDLLGQDPILSPVIAKATRLTVENGTAIFHSGQ